MIAKLKAVLQSKNLFAFAFVLIILTASVGLLLETFSHKEVQEVVIRHQQTKEEYLRMEVLIGDQIELSWIHSVEKTPWVETLKVSKGEQLKLVETRFKSFGAGVPHNTTNGEVYIKDGYTVMTGLNQMFSTYRWIHSHQARFSISVKGEQVVSPGDIPHHQAVEMIIEKR